MATMRMTAWEEERLLIFTAAELARRHRTAGLKLNAPEAIALICDAMLEAGRGGRSHAEIAAAGTAAVAPTDVMDGVRELVDEVRLEVFVGDGTRLLVLVDPLGRGRTPAAGGPGAIRAGPGRDDPVGAARERLRISVTNESRRTVRVSSHFPFDRVNRRLIFNRIVVAGFRLDLPAGTSERWAPGETKEVGLVRYGGSGGEGADDPEEARTGDAAGNRRAGRPRRSASASTKARPTRRASQ
jgi:urease subunit gamma/beta